MAKKKSTTALISDLKR